MQVPIYASIDDDPSLEQYQTQVASSAHLHQVEIDKRHVCGVGVDINNICKPQFGQWA